MIPTSVVISPDTYASGIHCTWQHALNTEGIAEAVAASLLVCMCRYTEKLHSSNLVVDLCSALTHSDRARRRNKTK